jgi:hypothetical protein
MALSDFMSVPFLICLGITLILVGVVGIYFTQKMQEQNHKISSMMGLVSTMAEEMNYMRSRLIMASQNNFQQHPSTDINNITPNMTGGQNTDTNDKLIDVSDGEDESDEESDCCDSCEDSDSDEESDCDSDEDSDCDSHKSKTNINILDNVVANINIEDLLDVNNTIKIINFDEALNATTGEDINIENDSESIDDSLGDSDSDSESDDDSDDDGEKTNNINLTQISNDSQLFNPELLKVIDISTISDESIKEKNDSNIDYKKMSLNKLRDIIVSKKLVSDPSKLKKNEMLKLLGSE